MDELTKVIDKLVEQKTFGLDALGAIKDLRDKAAKQEENLKDAKREIDERRGAEIRASNEVKRLTFVVNDWTQRQAELENRERKVFDLEKASAVAVAESKVWDRAFSSIFKNTIVREQINRDIPVTRNYGGSGGDVIERHNIKTVVDRETE